VKARKLNLATNADGTVVFTAELDRSAVPQARSLYDDLRDADIDLAVKKWREKRSLDANGYFWVLADKVAKSLGADKVDVYRNAVKDIGGVSETVCVKDEAVEKLRSGWEHNGLGWQTDTLTSKIPGCTNVVLYYGSSTYDTKQMSALIDHIVQDAKSIGIETATPEELARMTEEWK
jgi:hypothetical protein